MRQGHGAVGVQVRGGRIEPGDDSAEVAGDDEKEDGGHDREEDHALFAHGVHEQPLEPADEHFEEVLKPAGDKLHAPHHDNGHQDEDQHVEPGVGHLDKVVPVVKAKTAEEFIQRVIDKIKNHESVFHLTLLLRICR